MKKTSFHQVNPLSLAVREIMTATMCPSELLSFLTKMVYYMHTIRVGEEDADKLLTGMAGDNTSCIYAALLLIENFIPAWYIHTGEEPDDSMIEEFTKVLELGGIELWRNMIAQFRMALALDVSQGAGQLRTCNLIEYYTSFSLTITHCEAYLAHKDKLLKAA